MDLYFKYHGKVQETDIKIEKQKDVSGFIDLEFTNASLVILESNEKEGRRHIFYLQSCFFIFRELFWCGLSIINKTNPVHLS